MKPLLDRRTRIFPIDGFQIGVQFARGTRYKKGETMSESLFIPANRLFVTSRCVFVTFFKLPKS